MKAAVPGDYEETFYLKSANLELTSACNLRCTYCSVSQPDYHGKSLSADTTESALAGLREMKVNSVALNGHGETTLVEGWHEIIPAIRKTGARVHLTSNFARLFSADEIEAMLALTSVLVSIDTDDAALLRQVRRSVNLETILENIHQLQDQAKRRRVQAPLLIANCVVHTHNVMHLDRFVRFALVHGIRGFSFCNLIKNPELPGALNVDHVTTLSHEELAAAQRKLREAKGIAFSRGASCEIQSGLLDSIEQTLKSSDAPAEATLNTKRRYFTKPKEGETRDCLDPWFFALIQADASVRPCCWHPPVGSLMRAPLKILLNSDAAMSLRRQLTTGALCECCQTCPARPSVEIAKFEEVLHREVPRNRFAGKIRRAGISVKHYLRKNSQSLSGRRRGLAAM